MSPNDSAGRIHKQTFVVSTIVLFVISLVSVFARLYIRLRLQKQAGIDDAFLLLGTGCLVAAMVLLFLFINKMYMTEAFLYGIPDVQISPNFIEDAFWYHKISAIALILAWCSLMSVKFCFLVLFRKLVDRIRPMVRYWWFVTIFNIAVAMYGIAVYIAACPYFGSYKALQCAQGAGLKATFNFSLSQMILDLVGDFLILLIPCRLIWKIRIKWTHKLALASSLCLTIVVIICTICRISGLISEGRVDSIWETYWIYIAATIGLTLTAATAFRSLYVSHHTSRDQDKFPRIERLYTWVKQALRRSFTIRSWSSRSTGDSKAHQPIGDSNVELGGIERGTITGLRTFFNDFGRSKTTASQVMQSSTTEGDDDTLPLSDKPVSNGFDENHHDNKIYAKPVKVVDRPERQV